MDTHGHKHEHRKREQAPLFKPQANMTWANGMPNTTEFMLSRQMPSTKMNNIKPSIISNNNNGPTQKQLEARRRIEEQMKNKKTTQRTNVNKTKVAITVTDTKEIINDIDKKDMGTIGTGIRVYDWSSKWK